MTPHSDSILAASDGLELLRDADGRYVLLLFDGGRVGSVGTYDHVTEVWAALDRRDTA
ncbi:MAG TPA: hypothetical protein VD931_09880 [Baekduia sp.]|nr:hypothetical protein [Baekduia sp.]